MKPEKVIRDGMVAVLISPGYGAGWSSWRSEHAEMLAFDRRFVEAAEAGVAAIKPVVEAVLGKDVHVYVGGWRKVVVKWLPVGTRFRIDEYDGHESLVTAEDMSFVA